MSTDLQGQVDFVGIASQETGNPHFMLWRLDVTWRILAHDVGGRNRSGLSEQPGARGMPLTAFHDEDGRLLHTQLGALSDIQLSWRSDNSPESADSGLQPGGGAVE